MRLLIDTSGSSVILELMKGDRSQARLEIPESRQSKTLLKGIKEFLAVQGLKTSDITELAVHAGPGSYTGLRVGITVAKTWAFARGIPLYKFGAGEKIFERVDDLDKLEPIYENDHFAGKE